MRARLSRSAGINMASSAQAKIDLTRQRFGDDGEPDRNDDAGKGERERVLVAGEMVGEADAEQAAERAADDEQEGHGPIDQAGRGMARRGGQPEGGARPQR